MELTRNLAIDTVRELEPTPAREIASDATVAEAVENMRQARIGCLLVTQTGRLIGIFTERDLLKKVLAVGLPLSRKVEEVMTPEPVSVRLSDSVGSAVRQMQSGGYRHLPVVDQANRPVGILSAKRIVHYLVEHFPGVVYNQPPDPHRYPDSPEGA